MKEKHQEVISYSPLNIPKRQRKPGESIWCGKCNCQVTDTCKQTGKSKSSCKFPEHHRFQSRTYDKIKKRTVPVKTWPKELRDYNEFTRLHPIEVAKYHNKGVQHIFKKKPSLLRDALKKYFDWLNDIGVKSHQKKNLSPKHIQNQLANLVSFRESQPEYESILVKDVNDEHVALFHDLLESRSYSGKTYNNKMYTLNHAFEYFINDLGYSIQNPFASVSNKETTANSVFVELSDFKNLLLITTEENGIKFEKCSDRVKRVSLHRPWLTLFWELALYTGGRREDVAELKLSDVKPMHLEIHDFKVSKKKKTDRRRLLPRSEEFDNLLNRLIDYYQLTGDDYLIEPKDPRRTTLSNHASKAFTHYWSILNPGYYARMYSLRDTHITLMIKRYGNRYEGVFGTHTKIKASLENYANYEELIKDFAGKSMIA